MFRVKAISGPKSRGASSRFCAKTVLIFSSKQDFKQTQLQQLERSSRNFEERIVFIPCTKSPIPSLTVSSYPTLLSNVANMRSCPCGFSHLAMESGLVIDVRIFSVDYNNVFEINKPRTPTTCCEAQWNMRSLVTCHQTLNFCSRAQQQENSHADFDINLRGTQMRFQRVHLLVRCAFLNYNYNGFWVELPLKGVFK